MNSEINISLDDAKFARNQLLQWFEVSARAFPWRYDSNPYHILIAEMMLRRTQARQVVPVYKHFLEKYPDVETLNQASSEEVASVLYPLGLSWRAENFKIVAYEIVTRHHSIIPHDKPTLLTLTGVGPYVAEAIRSFAFNEISVIMDTNTVRVAARYFGFDYNPESRRRKDVIHAVSYLVSHDDPAKSNYALLDFAAIVCHARNPMHEKCPLVSRCKYYKKTLE